MKDVQEYLSGLDIRNNAIERLLYQITDLSLIRFKGIQSGDILTGDEIHLAIDKAIDGFTWLHSKGLSFEKEIKDKLSEEELIFYKEFNYAFSIFNEFMRTHMHLTINESIMSQLSMMENNRELHIKIVADLCRNIENPVRMDDEKIKQLFNEPQILTTGYVVTETYHE